MNNKQTAKRVSIIRKVGWLSVASMLALALLAPSTALAGAPGADDNLPNSGDTSNTGGVVPTMNTDAVMTCNSDNVVGNVSGSFTLSDTAGPNTFVIIYLTPNTGSDADAALTEDNQVKVDISGQSGTVNFSLDITTPFTTTKGGVLAVFAMDVDGTIFHSKSNSLNCTEGTTTTSTSSSSTTETSSTSTSTTETSSTSTSTTETSSTTETTSTTETSTTPETTTTSSTTASTTTPQQSVEGETDAPTPNVTLPPTDTLGGPAAPSNDSWRILLIAGAMLLASVLVLSPAKASRRR
jgi:hypothetical protein